MNTAVDVRYQLLRAFRNVRFFVFSLVFPIILFYLVAGPNRHEQFDGISFPVYYMAGMVAWGTMAAVVAGGARIAAERAIGRRRQMGLTPLPVHTDVEAKVLAVALTVLAVRVYQRDTART